MARWCLVILFATLIAGCKSGEHADPAAAGFELSLYSRDETGSESYYQVNRDGTLGFGGGIDARMNRTTWSGPLFPDEIRRLRELLDAQDWFRTKPESTRRPPGQIYRVSIHSKQTSRTFQLKGEHKDIQPIQELLDTAALRRLEVDLRRLPQPSIRRQDPVPATAPDS